MLKSFILVLVFCSACLYSTAFAGANNGMETVFFKRTVEPNEQAFSLLIPEGWQIEGGIIRIDPTAQGGAAQSLAAKVDFKAKRDAAGSTMVHWLPDILYFDPRRSIAGQMGLIQIGSNYSGMPVYYVMSAQDFLTQLLFPYLHPRAGNVRVIERRALPSLVKKYQQQLSLFQIPLDFTYSAAAVTVVYEENGMRYKEKLITVIEDMGQMGGGIWDNKETFFFRAPANEFDQLEPIISVIQGSVKINMQWLGQEIRGQIHRGEIMLKTQRYIQEIDRQIVEQRQNTNAEINKDMFLTLTGQSEYVNPFTNETETGSSEWGNRWVNENGDVVYSNDTDYDPNQDSKMGGSFKRSTTKAQKGD